MFPRQGRSLYKRVPWSRDSQRGQKKCVSVKFQMLKSHNKGHKKLSVWQPLNSFVIFEVFSPRVNGFTDGGQRPGTKRGKCRFHPFSVSPRRRVNTLCRKKVETPLQTLSPINICPLMKKTFRECRLQKPFTSWIFFISYKGPRRVWTS